MVPVQCWLFGLVPVHFVHYLINCKRATENSQNFMNCSACNKIRFFWRSNTRMRRCAEMNLTHSWLCASPLPGHCQPLSVREFCRWFSMPIWNEGKFSPLFTDHWMCCKRYPSARKYLSQLIVSLKNTGTSF
jgi:hypothetical protein